MIDYNLDPVPLWGLPLAAYEESWDWRKSDKDVGQKSPTWMVTKEEDGNLISEINVLMVQIKDLCKKSPGKEWMHTRTLFICNLADIVGWQ
jgi:hypothetical protein